MGVDRVDVIVNDRKMVDTCAHRPPHVGRRGAARAKVSAEIGEGTDPERHRIAVSIEGHRSVRCLSPPLIVCQKDLTPAGKPTDRTAQLLCRPKNQRLFGIKRVLGAETTTNILDDCPHPILGQAEDITGEGAPYGLRFSRRCMQGEALLAFVPLTDITPCFHGILHKATIHRREPDNVRRRGKCGVGLGCVTHTKAETFVPRRLGP